MAPIEFSRGREYNEGDGERHDDAWSRREVFDVPYGYQDVVAIGQHGEDLSEYSEDEFDPEDDIPPDVAGEPPAIRIPELDGAPIDHRLQQEILSAGVDLPHEELLPLPVYIDSRLGVPEEPTHRELSADTHPMADLERRAPESAVGDAPSQHPGWPPRAMLSETESLAAEVSAGATADTPDEDPDHGGEQADGTGELPNDHRHGHPTDATSDAPPHRDFTSDHDSEGTDENKDSSRSTGRASRRPRTVPAAE